MKDSKKDSYLGGLGILAAVSYLCLWGMKKIDAKLREKAQK